MTLIFNVSTGLWGLLQKITIFFVILSYLKCCFYSAKLFNTGKRKSTSGRLSRFHIQRTCVCNTNHICSRATSAIAAEWKLRSSRSVHQLVSWTLVSWTLASFIFTVKLVFFSQGQAIIYETFNCFIYGFKKGLLHTAGFVVTHKIHVQMAFKWQVNYYKNNLCYDIPVTSQMQGHTF